jgi:hypothetical protein
VNSTLFLKKITAGDDLRLAKMNTCQFPLYQLTIHHRVDKG